MNTYDRRDFLKVFGAAGAVTGLSGLVWPMEAMASASGKVIVIGGGGQIVQARNRDQHGRRISAAVRIGHLVAEVVLDLLSQRQSLQGRGTGGIVGEAAVGIHRDRCAPAAGAVRIEDNRCVAGIGVGIVIQHAR